MTKLALVAIARIAQLSLTFDQSPAMARELNWLALRDARVASYLFLSWDERTTLRKVLLLRSMFIHWENPMKQSIKAFLNLLLTISRKH
jgi:hypothetical protein